MVPSYISDIIPATVAHVFRYELRNSETIYRIPVRTSTFSKSCISFTINEWYNLQASVRDCDSYNSVCYTLKLQSLNKIPNYVFDGKRKFSILHAILRNFCSNLNQDLFDNHLRDDPICSCLRGAETVDHYFFKCEHYIEERVCLFRDTREFHPLNVNILLQEKKLCLIMITLGLFNSFKLIYMLRADILVSNSLCPYIAVHV